MTDNGQAASLFARAVRLHREGRLSAARAAYEDVIGTQPRHVEAIHLLGVLVAQLGELERADQLLALALQLEPKHAAALNNRGNVLKELGRAEEAVGSYEAAIALRPDYADAHYNLGVALQGLGRPADAVASYDKAIALRPGHAEAHSNRGAALVALGNPGAAVASYEAALRIRPDFAEAHCNLGIALKALARHDAAIASYDRAVALKPDYADAYAGRGLALLEFGRFVPALADFDRAIALRPDNAAVHCNRGAALHQSGELEAAVDAYRRAVQLEPGEAEAHYNLGVVLQELARLDQAESSFRKALALRPDFARARWALALVGVSPLAKDAEDRTLQRQAIFQALDDLEAWFDDGRLDVGAEAVATGRLFYLSYQETDNRRVLERYGALCHRLMDHWQRAHGVRPHALAGKGRIRIGIVSDHVRRHSVWSAIVKGIVANIDRSRFELHLFSLASFADDETAFARSSADRFFDGKRSLAQWVDAIAGSRVEVLIYPEVGMHGLTTQLACLRLAPLQLAMWGHPDTTGLPSIDYYVSGSDLEPEGAEANYSEQLLRLPHLGCSYARRSTTPVVPSVCEALLRDGRPLLLCPGTTFKYQPEYDRVLVEIAAQLGPCRFAFFTQQRSWSAHLRERLGKVFGGAGLNVDDFVSFLPWLDNAEFLGLMQRADIYLDTIGFSGFNTAMQAVQCCLPIVTREGRFMRGRLASAILKRMGMPELVAPSEEGYVRLAVRLGKDAQYRQAVRREMAEKQSVLFDDLEPIRALETFLHDRCRSPVDAGL